MSYSGTTSQLWKYVGLSFATICVSTTAGFIDIRQITAGQPYLLELMNFEVSVFAPAISLPALH